MICWRKVPGLKQNRELLPPKNDLVTNSFPLHHELVILMLQLSYLSIGFCLPVPSLQYFTPTGAFLCLLPFDKRVCPATVASSGLVSCEAKRFLGYWLKKHTPMAKIVLLPAWAMLSIESRVGRWWSGKKWNNARRVQGFCSQPEKSIA